mmetsp:Transcript_24410/g.59772  ORF Transcript_24410/g.59772 Transcript_24410/m.59772 type:complete len:296 (+) Transcript_24410:31-918(+)
MDFILLASYEYMQRLRILFVDPASGANHLPVLDRKRLDLIVLNVFIKKVMKDWQVIEGNHWVSMVLSVKVGFPQEPTEDKGGLHGSGSVKLVGDTVTVGVLSVADKIDGSVTEDTRNNPPEAQLLQVLKVIAIGGENSNVDSQLEKREELQLRHDRAGEFIAGGALHAPPNACVVSEDSHRRSHKAARAVPEVAEDIPKGIEVHVSRLWNTLELKTLELMAREKACEFGISINIEGVDMVLLVVDRFVPKNFEESSTDKEGHSGIEPLCLEGISMEQLVSSCKAHALHLESIEEV